MAFLIWALKKGDKIITITNNRPEWNFADMGMSMIGVIHVPVFTSLNLSEYQYIIHHSEAKIILVSDKKLYKVVGSAAAASGQPVQVYSFDEIEGVKSWKEIVETGRLSSAKHKQTV